MNRECNYCDSKKGYIIADFYRTDGGVTKIRACKEHMHLARMEQDRVSFMDYMIEKNKSFHRDFYV